MPEGLEAAIYASAAAELVEHQITSVEVDERCGDINSLTSLVGDHICGVKRHGKRVALVTECAEVELYFAMTGRLIVNGVAPIAALEYGPANERREWDRLVIETDRGSLRVNDPRRWARFTLDPDWSNLGIDFMSPAQALGGALQTQCHRRCSIKTLLLDQHVIAGLGNMLVDESLFHAGIDPRRPCASLSSLDVDGLAEHISAVVTELESRGGSHTGTLNPDLRRALAGCPLDGAPLQRMNISGRTTIFCSHHQR